MNMDFLDEFEFDQKLLNELKSLFEFVPPNILRRSLIDLFFNYLTQKDEPELPNKQQIFSHFYFLINFLEEAECN